MCLEISQILIKLNNKNIVMKKHSISIMKNMKNHVKKFIVIHILNFSDRI